MNIDVSNIVIIDNKTLVIQGFTTQEKIGVYVKRLLLLLALVPFYFFNFNMFSIIVLILVLGSAIYHFNTEFFPPEMKPKFIYKEKEHLVVGRKKMVMEELIFLSIRENESYKIIRIEGIRKNIMIANEAILCSECKDFETALERCRIIRNFISPNLKINNIKIGSGYSNSFYNQFNPRSSRDSSIEIWEYVD